jgi:molybdopterin molybdotransferase
MSDSHLPKDMLGRSGLIKVSEAQAKILKRVGTLRPPIESIGLQAALDRVCAHPVRAPEDLPTDNRSTMDGYAVVSADTYGASQSTPAYLEIAGEVQMGVAPIRSIHRGICLKIPTGGILPAGADAVVMHEHTVEIDGSLIEVVRSVGAGSNVITRGDDIRAGDEAMASGKLLRPQDLGLLAGLGITEVTVFKPITVGIISTGDEVVDYRDPLEPGKIRNINSILLAGACSRLGALVRDYGIVSDRESVFFSTVETAVSETDLVLFSGGSSVGMRDLGTQAIERLGDPGILVHGVSLKPGKPVIIGLTGKTPVFGLPGHPVSAMVCFDLFVLPVVLSISGRSTGGFEQRPALTATLMRNVNSAAGRLDVVRVRLVEGNEGLAAYPVLGKSGAISTLSRAHGYFLIAEDSQGCAAGETIEVYVYQ